MDTVCIAFIIIAEVEETLVKLGAGSVTQARVCTPSFPSFPMPCTVPTDCKGTLFYFQIGGFLPRTPDILTAEPFPNLNKKYSYCDTEHKKNQGGTSLLLCKVSLPWLQKQLWHHKKNQTKQNNSHINMGVNVAIFKQLEYKYMNMHTCTTIK